MPMSDDITYDIEDGQIAVTPANETKRARAFWGMQRTLVSEPGRRRDRWLHQGA